MTPDTGTMKIIVGKMIEYPIIILSNYRTGSSAFGISLKPEKKFKFFGEPAQKPAWLDEFINFYHTGSKEFILKIMIDQLDDCHLYREILNGSGHKIRLLRENELDQCISYYIATKRDIWQYKRDTIHHPYTVPIDLFVMEYTSKIIIRNNKQLRDFPMQFDRECVYETLNIPESSNMCKIVPPENIDELRKTMIKIISDNS